MKLTNYKPHAARHIMVYGPPKVGKTIAVLQLANYGYNLWYVDGEDSIKSAWAVDANGNRLISDEALERINLIKLPDSMAYPIMGETVLKLIKGGPCKICWDHGKVSCPICSKKEGAEITEIDVNTFGPKDILVIETATQIGNSFIAHIKQKEIKADTQIMDLKLDFDEWAKQGFLMDRISSTIQVAPYNVIITSHEEVVKMNDKSDSIAPKMGTRNFSKNAAKYFDDVVYLDKVNNKLKMYSSATYRDSVVSGSRAGKLVEKEGSRGLVELFE